jgi:hypothetical protein
MRHPRPDVAGEIDVPEEAVSMHRMSGWLTEDENPDLFVSDSEPEDGAEAEAETDDSTDEEPEASGGQTKRPRRARSRATSEEKDED